MRKILLFVLLLFTYGIPLSAQAELVEIVRLGRGTAQALSWHPSGNLLAVGGSAGVWLFDENYQQLQHHPAFSVRYLEFSPNGEYLAVSDFDNHTEFWILDDNGDLLERSQPVNLNGYSLRWSPTGEYVSTYSGVWEQGEFKNVQIDVWDVSQAKIAWTKEGANSLGGVVWSSDGQQLAAMNREGSIDLLNAANGNTIKTIQMSDELSQQSLFEIVGIEFHSDDQGLWLIFSGSDYLWSWDFNTDELTQTDNQAQFIDYGMQGLEKHPTGPYLVTETIGGGGSYGELYVFSEGNESFRIGYSHDFIKDYSWIPDTDRMSLLTGNSMIREFSIMDDANAEYQLFSDSGTVEWSPDSRWLLQTTGLNPYDSAYPITAWDMTEVEQLTYEPTEIMYPYLSAK